MKKMFCRLPVLCIALMLIMSLTAPALADDDRTITVTGSATVSLKADMATVVERLKDRVKVLHIKDGFGDKVTRGIPLGRGTSPVRDCVAYGYRNSIPMIVENETYFPSGLDEIKMSIDYLRSLEK